MAFLRLLIQLSSWSNAQTRPGALRMWVPRFCHGPASCALTMAPPIRDLCHHRLNFQFVLER
jgi:hypothetical protein